MNATPWSHLTVHSYKSTAIFKNTYIHFNIHACSKNLTYEWCLVQEKKNKKQKLNLKLGKSWHFLSRCFPHSNDGNPVIYAHNYTKVSRKCWDPFGKLSEWVWLRTFSNKQIFCIYTRRLHAILHGLSENEQFLHCTSPFNFQIIPNTFQQLSFHFNGCFD